jgi:hypothetical protein
VPVDLTRRRPQPPSNRAIALCGFLSSLTDQKTLLLYRAFFRQFLVPDATITPRVGALVADLAIPAGLAGRVPGVLAMRGRLRNRSSRGLLIGVGIGLALAHREQPACRGVEPGVANQGRAPHADTPRNTIRRIRRHPAWGVCRERADPGTGA